MNIDFPVWYGALAERWLAEQRMRPAHAHLIQAPEGCGARAWLWAAAAARLCSQPLASGRACGRCEDCRWVQRQQHPDLLVLRPQAVAWAEGYDEESETGEPSAKAKDPSREIRVEQIRTLESWAAVGAHRGQAKIVLLYPAEALNPISANALLKVLEEPAPGLQFLLLCHRLPKLIPTIISRCRRLVLGTPDPAQAQSWLEGHGLSAEQAQHRLDHAAGAPEWALASHEAGEELIPGWLQALLADLLRPGQVPSMAAHAEALAKQDLGRVLDTLQRLLVDAQRCAQHLPTRYYTQAATGQALAAWIARWPTPLDAAWELGERFRRLGALRPIATHPLNARLFAYEILFCFFGQAERV